MTHEFIKSSSIGAKWYTRYKSGIVTSLLKRRANLALNLRRRI